MIVLIVLVGLVCGFITYRHSKWSFRFRGRSRDIDRRTMEVINGAEDLKRQASRYIDLS